LLPIQKIHFTQSQQYDETIVFNLEEYDVRHTQSQPKKAGGNVTTHAQNRII